MLFKAQSIVDQLEAARHQQLLSILKLLSLNGAHTFRAYPEESPLPNYAWTRWRCIYGGNLSKKVLFLFAPHVHQHRLMLGAFLAAVKQLMHRGSKDSSAYFEADAAISLTPFQPDHLPFLQAHASIMKGYDAVIEVAPSYEGGRGLAIKVAQPEALLVKTFQSLQPDIPVRDDFDQGNLLQSVLGPQAEVVRLEILIPEDGEISQADHLTDMQQLLEQFLPAYCQHGVTQRKVIPYVA